MTRSDDFEVAMPVGTAAALPFEGRGVPAGPRARVADTDGDNKIGAAFAVIRDDVVNGWPWRSAPPALRDVAGAAKPAVGVPGDSAILRGAWIGWNYLIAIPATALLYVLAWLLQHPARAIPVGGVTAAITLISLYG